MAAWPRFLDLPRDELLEIVALLVAFEGRVKVPLLGRPPDAMLPPLWYVLVRDEQPVGPDVHAVLGPSAEGCLRDVVGLSGDVGHSPPF